MMAVVVILIDYLHNLILLEKDWAPREELRSVKAKSLDSNEDLPTFWTGSGPEFHFERLRPTSFVYNRGLHGLLGRCHASDNSLSLN